MKKKHPEVKDISFLISLYAGNSDDTNLLVQSIGYSSLICIVTKPILIRQSAGNQLRCYITIIDNNSQELGTSETTRENLNINQRCKTISVHQPTHQKPLTDEQFGHYLAGLIEGDGNFSLNKIVIAFHESDASLAYFIKERIGYGNVKKIKDKKALTYIVSNFEGRLKIANLINGKLRTNKIESFKTNIINNLNNLNTNPINLLPLNKNSLLDNHWLAGFIDSDGSFQIKILNRVNRKLEEVRLSLQIDQKTNEILIQIKNELKGSIGYRKKTDCFYYSSVNFNSAYLYINYLDKYHLQSSKIISFNKWRSVYLMIMNRKHLTQEGIDQIKKIKLTLNSHLTKTFTKKSGK